MGRASQVEAAGSLGLITRLDDGGRSPSNEAGRIGRGTTLPPQLGRRSARGPSGPTGVRRPADGMSAGAFQATHRQQCNRKQRGASGSRGEVVLLRKRRQSLGNSQNPWSRATSRKQSQRSHNPKVAGSNPAPATQWKGPETQQFPGLLRCLVKVPLGPKWHKNGTSQNV